LTCGTTLEQRKEHGIIIDHCPKCGGVWLDPGELEALTGHSSHSSHDRDIDVDIEGEEEDEEEYEEEEEEGGILSSIAGALGGDEEEEYEEDGFEEAEEFDEGGFDEEF